MNEKWEVLIRHCGGSGAQRAKEPGVLTRQHGNAKFSRFSSLYGLRPASSRHIEKKRLPRLALSFAYFDVNKGGGFHSQWKPLF